MKYDQLVEHAEGYPGSLFATEDEHRKFSETYLSDERNRERVIAMVLNVASQQSGDSADLANRIIDRMARTDAGWAGAKPQFYALPAPGGLGVALAIYDTFWTERW
ncbi:MAG: hypothetical protein ACRDZR_00160 [Acidimicrobiales bacterium]